MTTSPVPSAVAARPSRAVVAVAVLTALWCVGFAAVNVTFELTGHFDDRLGALAPGVSVMDWIVVALKVLGAVVAWLAVTDGQRLIRPATLTVLLWGAFATLATYVAGSLVEAVAFAAGLAGDRGDLTPRSVAYVLFFLLAAAGFGVLAVSYARRQRSPRRLLAWGALGAPLVLGSLLVVIPAILAAVGLLPTT
jgi:hypothetical protein